MPPRGMPMRGLALCADDFGRDAATSAVIADLAARGRLAAVSCLSGAPGWRAAAPRLAGLRQAPTATRPSCGLHFNLTEGEPLSPALRRCWPQLPGLPRLIVAAHLGRLPLAAIADEWRAQWAAFADAAGEAPAHADGHQHVHHLPGVREIVVEAVAKAGIALRNTGRVIGPGHAVKRALIAATGGRALLRTLRARGIAHNAALSGVYDFRGDYRRHMQAWLAALPPEGALLFCHPGAARPADPIGAARAREAAYLASAAFDDDLAAAGVALTPAGWRRG